MNENVRWYISLSGEDVPQFGQQLEQRGVTLTGMGHGVGAGHHLPVVDSYGATVVAATAEQAVEFARAAAEGLPIGVNATSVRRFSDD